MNLNIPLNQTEHYILDNLFQSGLASAYQPHFSTQSLLKECKETGIAENDFEEALFCLIDRGYLSGSFSMGSSLPHSLQLSDVGFDEACQLFLPDYDQIQEYVAKYLAQISEREDAEVKAMADKLGKPFLIVHHFLDFFARLGWVKVQREGSEFAYITYISPLVKRSFATEV